MFHLGSTGTYGSKVVNSSSLVEIVPVHSVMTKSPLESVIGSDSLCSAQSTQNRRLLNDTLASGAVRQIAS